MKVKKNIKTIFIACILFSNTNVFSQNSKDNAPEVYKFDALQTSNMVDLMTGNFHYNVPVLNIPGPEGGYNVALSYNAGIKMEDDASWVGLGWSFSPGSIMRNVNGAPDDFQKYEVNQEIYAFKHFVSPETSHNLFNQGWLNFAWYDVNGNYDHWDWSRFALVGGWGTDHFWVMARYYLYNAIKTGTSNLNNMVAGKNNYKLSVGAGTRGGGTGYFVSGEINNTQATLGSLNVVWDQNTVFLDIAHQEQDFQLFGNDKKYISGAFYLGDARHTDVAHGGELWGRQSYNYMMDIYTNKTGTKSNDKFSNNLSFPAYDDYIVSADGLVGNLSPVTMTDGSLLGEGYIKGNEYYQYMIAGNSNDLFSNGGQNNSTNTSTNSNLSFLFRGQHPTTLQKSGTFDIVNGGNNVIANPGIFQSSTALSSDGKIIGGKNVKTHFDSNLNIDGFIITDENGIVYNFSTPVYQYERIARTFDVAAPSDYMEQRMMKPYSYAWMLTSIVGADYIDVNANHVVDDADEGYWVKFDYGTWSDGYVWKTPYDKDEKQKSDENNAISSYEWGVKELKYLNSIETRTHKAYFVKFVREDALGADFSENTTVGPTLKTKMKNNTAFSAWANSIETNDSDPCANNPVCCDTYEVVDKLDGNGAPIPNPNGPGNLQTKKWTVNRYTQISEGTELEAAPGSYTASLFENSGKEKVLGLKKIILVKKDPYLPAIDLNTNFNYSANGISSGAEIHYKLTTSINTPTLDGKALSNKDDPYTPPCNGSGNGPLNTISQIDQEVHRGKYSPQKVYDIYDLANSTIESKAIQVVEFNYDYNLCKSAPNSTLADGIHNNGKLTLNSIDIKGTDGSKVAPSYLFNYGLNIPFSQLNTSTTNTPEWLKMQDDWGYRLDVNSNLKNITNKDDYDKSLVAAWSLTEVQTPLGGKIKVQYESDRYIKEAASTKTFNTQIKSFEVNNSGNCRNSMTIPIQSGFGTTPVFVTGNQYQIHLFMVKLFSCPSCSHPSPVLTGKFLSSTSSGGAMYAKFEIVAGWNDDYDFSQISGNYIIDGNSAQLPFTNLVTKHECNTVKIKYQDGVKVANAFIVNGSYTISLYGNNLISYTGGFPPLILTNAIVQSIDITTNEVVFLLGNYDVNFTNILIPDEYSYSTSESNGREMFGGGLRVKELLTEDENGKQYKTQYEYQNGVTSFAPGNLWRKDIKYISELPGPEVIYGKVIEKNVGANNIVNSITEYDFETMASNTQGAELTYGDQLYIENGVAQNPSAQVGQEQKNFHTRIGTIHNNTGRIGRLNKIMYKNTKGQVLSSKTYEYYNKEELQSGIIQESFHELKRKTIANDAATSFVSDWYMTYSSRIMYPTALKKIEETRNNLTTYVKYGNETYANNGFDIYTHSPLITDTKKATGEIYRDKIIPAYTKYTPLFSKTFSSNNKNIFSANTEQFSYIVNDQGQENVLGVTAQTFKNTWDYRDYNPSTNSYIKNSTTDLWRKDLAYVWKTLNNSDGTALTFTDFNWASGATNTGWQNSGEPTLFNHFSKGLEMMDINNKFSSVKMGYNNAYVIASVTNANYTSFAYSGAEDIAPGSYFGGEVLGGGQLKNSLFAHTGDYSVSLPPAGGVGFRYDGPIAKYDFQKGKKIRASVWLYKQEISKTRLSYNLIKADGSSDGSGFVDVSSASTKLAGNWYLLTLDFTIPVNTTATMLSVYASRMPDNSSSLPIYFDDFRVHPQDAVMTSTVYDEKTGWVTAILDADNFATKFTYDAAGRLIRTDKETLQGFKKVSETAYHYGR